MTQARIDWDIDARLPVRGRTPQARHASASGANAAAQTRGPMTLAYLALLERAGAEGLSDYEAARMLGCGVSSICSIRDGCGPLVVSSGSFEPHVWPSGKVTKRARSRVRTR